MSTKIIRFSESIYSIDQGMARCYLIVGKKKALLFDTGVESVDIIKAVQTVTDLPVMLVLSHADPDHIANADQFDTIYAHEIEVNRCKDQAGLMQKKYVMLNDMDEIDLGEKTLQVIHIPGHARGHIGLIDKNTKDFFSGDTLSYGPVFLFVPNADMEQYLKTLYRLKGRILNGEIKKVYPCHNESPIDPQIIQDLIECCEKCETGALPGSIPDMSLPFGENVRLYKVHNCGILR